MAVGYLSRRVHAEGAKSAKRAEKTSKEAAAHALPAARAAREQTATRSTDASNAGSSVVCICGSRDRLAPAIGRPCRKGLMQPFSAASASLLPLREIVFSARCGARQTVQRLQDTRLAPPNAPAPQPRSSFRRKSNWSFGQQSLFPLPSTKRRLAAFPRGNPESARKPGTC